MKIIKNKKEIQKALFNEKSISLIPTMGGLHKGHISLLKKAKKYTKKIVVSIFINPKQFNSKADYFSYPKNIKNDLKILKNFKTDYVYMPSNKDIYGFKSKKKPYLDKFEKKLCGKFRPGHFNGVINVVNRLLQIIKPKFIFLGNKDFQQSVLIKKHIQKVNIKTFVVNCKTIRDRHGIAYSTRNKRLRINDIAKLRKIIKFLKKNKSFLRNNFFDKKSIRYLENQLKIFGATKIDYIEPLNVQTLKKPNKKNQKFNLFFAFYINKVRFIDNF